MRNDKYTLITGASDGFGKALALECAGRNMNLVLVSLPFTGLANLASFIKKDFGVRVYYFEHDLTKKEECYSLFSEINNLHIPLNVLINNAGMGGTHFFEEKDVEFYYRQIELNVVAPTLISRLFLDTLKENCPAHILNVSSMAGLFNLPRKQVYGGTKSFLVSFSKSLRLELLQKKVYVSVVCPGGMNTNAAMTVANFCLKGIDRWSILNPEVVAKITIDKMLQKKNVIVAGFWNHFFLFLGKVLPAFIKNRITMGAMKKLKVYNKPITPAISALQKAV